MADVWTGDLQTMCTTTWVEDDSEIVAISFSENGYGRVWFNLRLIHPSNERLVWHWGRRAASLRNFDVLYAQDIPTFWGDDREAVAS